MSVDRTLKVDEWPEENDIFKAVLLEARGVPHVLLQRERTCAFALSEFLNSQEISYKPYTEQMVGVPASRGDEYRVFGTGLFEVGGGRVPTRGSFSGWSRSYGLMLTPERAKGPLLDLLESHKERGIRLPNYELHIGSEKIWTPDQAH